MIRPADLARRWSGDGSGARGSILAAVLLMMALTGIWLGMAATKWSHIMRREREKELIFRGTQIARAIEEHSARGTPPTALVQMTKPPNAVLRQVYPDPMTARFDREGKLVEDTGAWTLIARGQQGQVQGTTPQPPVTGLGSGVGTPQVQPLNGVASKSEEESIGGYRDFPAESLYSDWKFEALGVDLQQGQGNVFVGGLDIPRSRGFGGFRKPGGQPVPPQDVRAPATRGGGTPPRSRPPR